MHQLYLNSLVYKMKKHKILTWSARIAGILVMVYFILFFIGEGVPDIFDGKGYELLRFLPFVLLSIIGFILAWKRPATGGWLMIAGGLLMAGYFLYFNDLNVAIIYSLPSVLIGLCFLASEEKALI